MNHYIKIIYGGGDGDRFLKTMIFEHSI